MPTGVALEPAQGLGLGAAAPDEAHLQAELVTPGPQLVRRAGSTEGTAIEDGEGHAPARQYVGRGLHQEAHDEIVLAALIDGEGRPEGRLTHRVLVEHRHAQA